MVHENALHQTGNHAKEMGPVAPLNPPLVDVPNAPVKHTTGTSSSSDSLWPTLTR